MLSWALVLWAACPSSCAAEVSDLQVIDADNARRSELLGRSLKAMGCSGPGTSQSKRAVTKAFLEHVRARGDDGGSNNWVIIDGKPDNPLDIINGCDFFYGMMFNETIRLSLVRPDENHYLFARWSRSPDNSYSEVVAELSWKTEPRDLMSQWPSNYSISSSYVDGHATYSHLVDSDAAAKRFYQKSSGGHYGKDDPMHIDLQAIRGSYVEISGFWRFSFVNASRGGLREDQYAPMEKLFRSNCELFRGATLADRAGSQAHWHGTNSSAKLCEWMRFGWDEISHKRSSPFACNLLEGVLCDDDGYITHIDLSGQGLQGKLDSAIGLDRLTRLEVLDLKNNLLDGSFTNFMQVPRSIRILGLSGNKFSGSIPQEIYLWVQVTSLDLAANELSGSLPDAMASLTGMTALNLSANRLSGSLPDAMGSLTCLTSLDLSANGLSGTFPAAMVSLTEMTSLDLSANGLFGSLPDAMAFLTGMTALNLSANQLSSSFPAAMASLTEMTSLDLSTNRLSGSLPAAMGSLTCLTSLDLSRNRFEGAISTALCYSGEHPTLQHLCLSWNRLSGTIPLYCINEADLEGSHRLAWQNIVELDLSSNRLSGTLPTFGNLTKLRKLSLAQNDLSIGSQSINESLGIPHENSLQGPNAVVRLDHNRLGQLPQWVLDLRGHKRRSATLCSWEMMPRPISINATDVRPGEAVIVEVCNIWLARPPRCKFFRKNHEATTDARVLEPASDEVIIRLECIVPESLNTLETDGFGEWNVTVANFGSEFTGEHLLENFYPPKFVLEWVNITTLGNSVDVEATGPAPKRRFGVVHFILVTILVLAPLKLGHHLYIRRQDRMKALQSTSYEAFGDDEELRDVRNI